MSKLFASTTDLRTGSSWQLEPTLDIWQRMSVFDGVSQERLAKMGRIIDLADKEAAKGLPLEEQLLCQAWSDVVSGLIPNQTYSIADLESQLRLVVAFVLVIYGCLADKLGDGDEFATHTLQRKEASCGI